MFKTIPLKDLHPSPNNVRRFVDPGSLSKMIRLYEQHRRRQELGPEKALLNSPIVLPPRPIVRRSKEGYEILSGERRVTAAAFAKLTELVCEVVEMTDEEAYKFSIEANESEGLTTVEKALYAANMANMGYSEEEVSELIGASAYRYIAVGNAIDKTWFTDTTKRCDPSITLWHEAVSWGKEHFAWCFKNWDFGGWELSDCERNFRNQDKGARPLDNKQKGLRISVNSSGREINIIGKIDLDMYTDAEVLRVVSEFTAKLNELALRGVKDRVGGFGGRFVLNLNPDTLA